MPKADLVLPNGTKVTIDGITEEVAQLLAAYAGVPGHAAAPSRPASRRAKEAPLRVRGRKGPTAIIVELREEGYFKSKRTLADIQSKLEERGHIYAKKTLAQLLVQLTRRKGLRRLKEGRVWEYVS